MNLLKSLKEKRRQKKALKEFRSRLQVGQRVIVDNGAQRAQVQVIHIVNDMVKVINRDMQYGAYGIESIYPVED